jgi:aspartate 1-decarboxylase
MERANLDIVGCTTLNAIVLDLATLGLLEVQLVRIRNHTSGKIRAQKILTRGKRETNI